MQAQMFTTLAHIKISSKSLEQIHAYGFYPLLLLHPKQQMVWFGQKINDFHN